MNVELKVVLVDDDGTIVESETIVDNATKEDFDLAVYHIKSLFN